MKGNGKGGFHSLGHTNSQFILEGEVRDIKALKTDRGEVFLVARNNMPMQIFKRLQSPGKDLEKPVQVKEGNSKENTPLVTLAE